MTQLGIYQHYKGGCYQVIGVAKHSETLEEMVVYQNIETKEMWVRPQKMFEEDVVLDGKTIKRFTLISQ